MREKVIFIFFLIAALVIYFIKPDNLVYSIIGLVFWLFVLIKAANYLIEWSYSLWLKLWIPSFVIWLTIVAFWTSLPELLVNIFSSLSWNVDLAFSNVIWSNITNILLILWISSLISPILVNRFSINYEIPFSLLITLVLFILINDKFFWWSENYLTRWDWLILLLLFLIFIYYVYWTIKFWQFKDEDVNILPLYISVLMIFFWIWWLYISWQKVVASAVNLANFIWISQVLVWIVLIAVWTSLPELVTSILAALSKKLDIAIWNIIWSNIFNILFILWVSWTINNLPYKWNLNIDILLLCFINIILLLFSLKCYRNNLWRIFWSFSLFLYIIYIIYVLYRG